MYRTQISCCLKSWESGERGDGEILSGKRAQAILGTNENVLYLDGSDSYRGVCICQNASHYIHKMGAFYSMQIISK